MSTRFVVYRADEPPWLAERTARALRTMGHAPVIVPEPAVAAAVRGSQAAWLLRAGAVPPLLPTIEPTRRRKPLLLRLPFDGGDPSSRGVAGYYLENVPEFTVASRRAGGVWDAIRTLAAIVTRNGGEVFANDL